MQRKAIGRSLRLAARLLPVSLGAYIRLSGQKLLLPVYHLCSEQAVPHIQHLYQIRSTRRFEEDLDTLLRHYVPLSLPELLAVMKGEQKLQKPSFWLSFDDGLREVYEEAVPLLRQKGVPATLFLNNDFLDNRALFYRYKVSLLIERLAQKPPSPGLQSILRERFSAHNLPREDHAHTLLQLPYEQRDFLDELAALLQVDFAAYLAERQPYLRRAEVRQLIAAGFSIGGHSLDHPEFRFLPQEEQLRQARESVRGLVEEFDLPYRVFAFPFTDFGVKRVWFEELLGPELDASFGSAGLKKDSFALHAQRVPMEGTDDTARTVLKAEYLYYLLKAPLGKNRIAR